MYTQEQQQEGNTIQHNTMTPKLKPSFFKGKRVAPSWIRHEFHTYMYMYNVLITL